MCIIKRNLFSIILTQDFEKSLVQNLLFFSISRWSRYLGALDEHFSQSYCYVSHTEDIRVIGINSEWWCWRWLHVWHCITSNIHHSFWFLWNQLLTFYNYCHPYFWSDTRVLLFLITHFFCSHCRQSSSFSHVIFASQHFRASSPVNVSDCHSLFFSLMWHLSQIVRSDVLHVKKECMPHKHLFTSLDFALVMTYD